MTLAKSGVGTFLSKERRQGLDSVSRFGIFRIDWPRQGTVGSSDDDHLRLLRKRISNVSSPTRGSSSTVECVRARFHSMPLAWPALQTT